jgi:hypothetical protein
VVEALACKADLSGFEFHRYLHTIPDSRNFGRWTFLTPSVVKRLNHLTSAPPREPQAQFCSRTRTVGIPNYPRDTYSESPMRSRNLHDKLRLSLNHPRWRLGFVRGIEPPFFVHFSVWTLTIRSGSIPESSDWLLGRVDSKSTHLQLAKSEQRTTTTQGPVTPSAGPSFFVHLLNKTAIKPSNPSVGINSISGLVLFGKRLINLPPLKSEKPNRSRLV